MTTQIKRCLWAEQGDAVTIKYHDNEWGAPLYDDNKIFEFLCLEGFQAGLSWRTILNKRKNFERAFANFNPVKVSKFTKKDFNRLMSDKGIVRNKLKIGAVINNASKFLEIKKEYGAFSKYIWSFVGNQPIVNTIRTIKDYKTTCAEAVVWAKDLKKRGFKFLGPTTIYAHMQASGMVNDHMVGCFKK